MKKLKLLGVLLYVIGIGMGICAFGIGDNVPQKVKDAFSHKFPSVKKVRWEKESGAEWEAEFRMKGTEYSANFLEDGTWRETEHKVRIKDVHANIIKMIETQFEGYKIEKTEFLETPQGIFYEFGLKKNGEELEITVNKDAKIVEKDMSEEE